VIPYRVHLINSASVEITRVVKAPSGRDACRLASDETYSAMEASFDWQGLLEGNLKPTEISELLLHLAEHQSAGIELLEAMRLEAETARTKRMRRIMARMVQFRESGDSLEDCFRNAGAWPEEMPSMIKAAYSSGDHIKRLKIISQDYERRAEQKRNSAQKLYAHLFTLATSSLACFIAFSQTVPDMVKHLDPRLIPEGTRTGIMIFGWLSHNLMFFSLMFACALMAMIYFKGRLFELLIPYLIKLPVFKSYIRGRYFSPFFYNLGMVISVGVHSVTALKEASAQNSFIKKKVDEYLRKIEAGDSLAVAIYSDELLGREAQSYLSLGDKVHNIGEQAMRLAKLYSIQMQNAAEKLTKFAMPLIILCSTLIILYMIIYGWAEPYKVLTNVKTYSSGGM
jgi:type II secretory pathway component PulF